LTMKRKTDSTVKLIDVSLPLNDKLPFWPGSLGFSTRWTKRLDRGDSSNNSFAALDVHSGTHIDAPLHFIRSGASVDQIPLDLLIGSCRVIHLPDIKQVTPSDLTNANIEHDTERLLIRTQNSILWTAKISEFKKEFTALSIEAARWIVAQGIRLLGIDYLSIGTLGNSIPVHQILLGAGVVVLEGLNLIHARPGIYELICLPLNIAGAEGAPVRAILRSMRKKS
jgi:arylformamidase